MPELGGTSENEIAEPSCLEDVSLANEGTTLPSGGRRAPSQTLIEDIVKAVAPFTMVPEIGVRFTIGQVIRVMTDSIPGVIVECGVWRGGCSIAMLLVQRAMLGRIALPVYLFDSFEGLPLADKADGPLARHWQQATDSPQFFDNCRASVQEVQRALDSFGFHEGDYHLVQGWFDQTIPSLRSSLAKSHIALLRLDADWYESTKVCLEELTPTLSDGGVVILDDYYAWDGAARAVHEYLAKHDLPYRVRSLPQFLGAYFVKKAHRDQPGALDDGVHLDTSLDSAPAIDPAFWKYYAQLEQAKLWLEEQRSRWEKVASDLERQVAEQQAWIAELENSKAWLSEQSDAWGRALRASEDWIGELETGKAWLAEQSEAWQRAFHASEAQRAADRDGPNQAIEVSAPPGNSPETESGT